MADVIQENEKWVDPKLSCLDIRAGDMQGENIVDVGLVRIDFTAEQITHLVETLQQQIEGLGDELRTVRIEGAVREAPSEHDEYGLTAVFFTGPNVKIAKPNS